MKTQVWIRQFVIPTNAVLLLYFLTTECVMDFVGLRTFED